VPVHAEDESQQVPAPHMAASACHCKQQHAGSRPAVTPLLPPVRPTATARQEFGLGGHTGCAPQLI
jgi:hypothetical protein